MCNDVSEAFDWAPVRGMLRQPLGGRMPGHREPQQLPPSVTENKKCEELFKGNRRNHKEINRSDDISVVAKEGFPGLQWPILPRYHILRHCRLGDIEAELEKLTMDVRSTPERALKAHSSDQVTHLLSDPRSATERARLPSPERTEAVTMPTHDCLGSDDCYGVKDARKATIEPNEQGTIGPGQI